MASQGTWVLRGKIDIQKVFWFVTFWQCVYVYVYVCVCMCVCEGVHVEATLASRCCDCAAIEAVAAPSACRCSTHDRSWWTRCPEV